MLFSITPENDLSASLRSAPPLEGEARGYGISAVASAPLPGELSPTKSVTERSSSPKFP